jgi:hypothetical protein
MLTDLKSFVVSDMVVHEVTGKPKGSGEKLFSMVVLYFTQKKETYITTFNLLATEFYI